MAVLGPLVPGRLRAGCARFGQRGQLVQQRADPEPVLGVVPEWAVRVHGKTGQPCPVCGDTIREVSFADSSLQYCPTCQTGGKPLADRRLSRLLK